MAEITKEVINGVTYDIKDTQARNIATGADYATNGVGESINSYCQLGRNIATHLADAIGSTEPVTWLKNVAASGKFNQYDLAIGDYLPVTLNNGSNTVMYYQIAAFDQYYGCGDTTNGHMITLVPTGVYPENILYNTTDNNNGNASENSPWRSSNLFTWMNETFYGYLPAAWQNALKNIRAYQPIRYSASGALTDDNGGAWMDLGKVWAPSEIEVWASTRRGTSLNEAKIACTDKLLPIFANRTVIRSRHGWWVRVPAAGSSAYVCYVSGIGTSAAYAATNAGVRPLPCFHIG